MSAESSTACASSSDFSSSDQCSQIYNENENELLELVYRLALEDLQDVQSSRKGKGKESAALTDEEIAFQLFEQEATDSLISISDYRIACSINNAVSADAECIEMIMALEEQASRDRAFALSLVDNRSAKYTQKSTTFSSSSINTRPSGYKNQAELTKKNSNIVKAPNESCVICFENLFGMAVKVPCGHFYDFECISDLFEACTKDETLYPPRCCRQPIPVEVVVGAVSDSLVARFERKALEFGTLQRLYCSKQTCSSFLGSKEKDTIAVYCAECHTNTCAACGGAAHPKEVPCTDDEESHFIVNLGEDLGWKRCPGCHRMVELNTGCNHMTCLCRTQFCYVCGVTPWKSCSCPQWDEQRLYAAGEERVNNALRHVRRTVNAPELRNMVTRAVENLRENHVCNHLWRTNYNPGQCQLCHDHLTRFLLCCVRCQIRIIKTERMKSCVAKKDFNSSFLFL